jgi:DNA processing protein
MPPAVLSVAGSIDPGGPAVAIVGTRKPTAAAAQFAGELAAAVVQRGAIVISGGAIGIDAAAHEGALAAGGRTWVVTGTGEGVLYPSTHGPLFERVVAQRGAMLWPFPPGTKAHTATFLQRNGVLVALAQVLVIIQARFPSGALNAALWARRLARPRWVVCPAPWDSEGFEGCEIEAARGASILTSVPRFLRESGIPLSPKPVQPRTTLNRQQRRVLTGVTLEARHVDQIAGECGLPYAQVMTALLTLALENVLVEGPDGFYRRAFV